MRRVPVHHQLESNDCGPACVQMIAHYYGRKYSLRTLKGFCELSRIGCSVKDISLICQQIGMTCYSVSISYRELTSAPLPAILYFRKGHFVVLDKIDSKNRFHIVDPDDGRITLSSDEISERLFVNGHAVCILLSPDDNFLTINKEDNDTPKNSLLNLTMETFASHKRAFLIVSLLTLCSMAITWVLPLIFRKTVDEGVVLKDIHLVWTLLISQLLFNIGYVVTNSISKLLLLKTSFKFGTGLIANYLCKIVDLPVRYFDTRFSSSLIQRIGDQDRVNAFIVDLLGGTLLTTINLLVFSFILIYFNPLIFVVFFVCTIVSFVYTLLFAQKRKQIDYSLFSLESARRNSIFETVLGMQDIKINNSQKIRIEDWNNYQNRINKYQLKSFYVETWFSEGVSFIDNMMNLVVTGLCALLVIRGQITIGTMMTTAFLLGQLTSPVNQLLRFSKNVQYAKLSNDRVKEITESPKEENEQKPLMNPSSLNKGLTFENVHFKYPGTMNPLILNNICLKINHHEVTAIVGVSGSGKTTLLKLLLGFYPVSKGHLMLGNNDIATINCDDWRSKCGVVMQDGYIFSGTVADNIAMNEKDPNTQKLENAIRIACLEDFVRDLPMGVHTKIGETGLPVSGGERQRILIARAVYRNPEYIFFDEATNSLDANNERAIMDNLNVFFKGKTVLIIAHRLSTVKNADKIVVLDKGKIVEQGTHTELTSLKGKYYQLVKNQLELGD
jgi:ATP-binding cassette, subfamily B, bacterial